MIKKPTIADLNPKEKIVGFDEATKGNYTWLWILLAIAAIGGISYYLYQRKQKTDQEAK
jgi:hypothetical protein